MQSKGKHPQKKSIYFRALPELATPLPSSPFQATWSFFCTYDTFIAEDLKKYTISLLEQLYIELLDWFENYGMCKIMLGIKGPKHSMLDKASQHLEHHKDLRVMTSQVQTLT